MQSQLDLWNRTLVAGAAPGAVGGLGKEAFLTRWQAFAAQVRSALDLVGERRGGARLAAGGAATDRAPGRRPGVLPGAHVGVLGMDAFLTRWQAFAAQARGRD